jgi:hypothetical protein
MPVNDVRHVKPNPSQITDGFPNCRLLHASQRPESFHALVKRPIFVAVSPLLMANSQAGCVCGILNDRPRADACQ